MHISFGLIYLTGYQHIMGYLIPKFEKVDNNNNYISNVPLHSFFEIAFYWSVYNNHLLAHSYVIASILILIILKYKWDSNK